MTNKRRVKVFFSSSVPAQLQGLVSYNSSQDKNVDF